MAFVNPNEGKDLTPFRFWCQKVLPLVYDDSLSYYELLCKVVAKLNETLDAQNALGDSVTEEINNFENAATGMQEAFEQKITAQQNKFESDITGEWNQYQQELNLAWQNMQNWINHYFDNLDVQQEINEKLDAMAGDGTLTNLLNPRVEAYTNAWLNSHITNPSSPPLDNTLTLQNAAAQAKTTGERTSALGYYSAWVDSISSNEPINIPFEPGTLYGKTAAVDSEGNVAIVDNKNYNITPLKKLPATAIYIEGYNQRNGGIGFNQIIFYKNNVPLSVSKNNPTFIDSSKGYDAFAVEYPVLYTFVWNAILVTSNPGIPIANVYANNCSNRRYIKNFNSIYQWAINRMYTSFLGYHNTVQINNNFVTYPGKTISGGKLINKYNSVVVGYNVAPNTAYNYPNRWPDGDFAHGWQAFYEESAGNFAPLTITNSCIYVPENVNKIYIAMKPQDQNSVFLTPFKNLSSSGQNIGAGYLVQRIGEGLSENQDWKTDSFRKNLFCSSSFESNYEGYYDNQFFADTNYRSTQPINIEGIEKITTFNSSTGAFVPLNRITPLDVNYNQLPFDIQHVKNYNKSTNHWFLTSTLPEGTKYVSISWPVSRATVHNFYVASNTELDREIFNPNDSNMGYRVKQLLSNNPLTWENKTWYAYGTSLTAQSTNNMYPYYLQKLMGANLTNRGIGSGAIVAPNTNIKDRIFDDTDGKENADLITLEIGANDLRHLTPEQLGTPGETEGNTYCAVLYQCVAHLQNVTNAQVVVFGSTQEVNRTPNSKYPCGLTYYEFQTLTKNVCDFAGCWFINIMQIGLGYNRIRKPGYIRDNIHPLPLGGSNIANALYSQLKLIPLWQTTVN